MEKLMNKKGIILFYLGVVICSYLYIWRVEKLEENYDYIKKDALVINLW